MYALDRAVNSSVDQIVAIQMPDNERAIVNLLNSLETLLESNSWEPEKDKEKKKAKIRNKYPDAVLNKFEQVLRELKFINANSERISFYQNRIDTFKKIQKKAKKAEVRQNIIIVTVILFIFLILIIASAA